MFYPTFSSLDDLAMKLELELLLGNHAGYRRRLRRALREAGLQNSTKRVSKIRRQPYGTLP